MLSSSEEKGEVNKPSQPSSPPSPSPLTERAANIAASRDQASRGQEKSVEKMLALAKKLKAAFSIGDLVVLKVPDVDRGPFDPNNLLCLIIEAKNGIFRLACRAGILERCQAANSFSRSSLLCDFTIDDVPMAVDKKGNSTGERLVLSVRETARELSVGNGQGYVKCSCAGQCSTKRCSCKAANIHCGSKCHGKDFECHNSEKAYADTQATTTRTRRTQKK